MRQLILLSLILSVLTLNIGYCQKNRRKQIQFHQIYDTVRVTVYDTIRVKTKRTPRVETLNNNQTPKVIDSLVEIWKQRQILQVDKNRAEEYATSAVNMPLAPIDTIYRNRLKNLVSPIQLPYNAEVGKYIETYLHNRWSPLSRILGLSKFYFPLIEEQLTIDNLPIELRAVAIIESNLSNIATSRMGAVGLWQLMPTTAKNLGLEVNSLVDERCDIIASTIAACRFLKDLHDIYGDWTLAIAAYNCGPGNVNKALARAGSSCTTFWDIYDYLPHETRNYVPKFIAASYAYAYHSLHNIESEQEPEYIATDTITISRTLHLQQVATTLGVSMEALRLLNPQYKIDIIPGGRKPYSLRLPSRYITDFITRSDEIYAKDSIYLKEYLNPANLDKQRAQGVGYIYKVKSGDNLGSIAKRNGTTVKNIMKWNHLRSSNIRIGQKLRIERPKPRS